MKSNYQNENLIKKFEAKINDFKTENFEAMYITALKYFKNANFNL